MAQVVAPDVRILLEGLALHPCPYAVGDRLGGKALFYSTEGINIRLAHRASGLPLCECAGINGEGKVGLCDAVAVDGLEVIAHGDDVVASLTPLLPEGESLFAVGMVAGIIVGYQHKGGRLVLRIAQRVVVHGRVAATVAERQHGHLAYLLRNLQHLVRLQVLDDELIGAHDVLLLAHGIIDASLRALTAGHEFHVHTDDAVGGDADAFRQRTADEAVGAADHVVGEAIVLQVFKDLQHGLIKTLAVSHARKTVGRLLGIRFDVGIELCNCHAAVGLCCRVCVLHVEVVGQLLAVAHEVAYFLRCFHHVLRRLVAGIVQHAVLQQVILEVRRVELADERAVHVERRDAVLLLDEVRRRGVGHVLHVVLQRRQRLALVPQREVFLRWRNDGIVVIILAARCQHTCAADHGEDGGEHP